MPNIFTLYLRFPSWPSPVPLPLFIFLCSFSLCTIALGQPVVPVGHHCLGQPRCPEQNWDVRETGVQMAGFGYLLQLFSFSLRPQTHSENLMKELVELHFGETHLGINMRCF